METGSLPFWSEVEVRASGWLLCFSDLQVELQYLSLGFYYWRYRIGEKSMRKGKSPEVGIQTYAQTCRTGHSFFGTENL